MFMQKIEGAFAIDRVGAHEGLQFAAVANAEFGGIEEVHLGKLPGDTLIRRDAVEMAAFDHKG